MRLRLHGWHSLFVVATACFFSLYSFAFADTADKLRDLVGYTIVDAKTIKGWYDDDEKVEGLFKGCRSGRVIIFADNTILKCTGYNYQYAYRPTAVILAKPISPQ